MPTNLGYSQFPRSHDAAADGGTRGTANQRKRPNTEHAWRHPLRDSGNHPPGRVTHVGKETIRRFSEDYPEDRETLSSIRNRTIRAIHAFDRLNRGTGRTATGMGDGGRACRDARRAYLAWCRLLNYRRAVADGIEPPPRGEYMGDGIARTLDGTPFEPLSGWDHLERRA